jgi:hypothetical protein
MALALMITLTAAAQNGCPAYPRLMQEAAAYANKHEFSAADAKYTSAKACAPSKRKEVDSIRNLMFQKMGDQNSQAARAARTSHGELREKKDKNAPSQQTVAPEKGGKDSVAVSDAYAGNNSWIKDLSPEDANSVNTDIKNMNKKGRSSMVDSLSTFFRILYDGKLYMEDYRQDVDSNAKVFGGDQFPADRKGILNFYRFRVLEIYYYAALMRIAQAEDLLPPDAGEIYRAQVTRAYKSLAAERSQALKGYWMPDTLVALPDTRLFAMACADNRNFIWGYTDYDDYRTVRLRCKGLSLPDLTLVTDSLIALADTGRYYQANAATGNYSYWVGRAVDYRVKPSRTGYSSQEWSVPRVDKLMDNKGNVLADFGADSTSGYFLTPDGAHLATWKPDNQLMLFETRHKKSVALPNSLPAPTMSFSSDSKSIAYYNTNTKTIYLSDLSGHVAEQIPAASITIRKIDNLDFTGGNSFLTIDNDDSICLFDLRQQKTLFTFNKSFVSEIVVAPNKKDILLSFNTVYHTATDTFYGAGAVFVDTLLNIRARLYSGCKHYFYSPGGDFLFGVGDRAIMRWTVDPEKRPPPASTCLSYDELVETKCLSFKMTRDIEDAGQLQTAAYGLKDMAEGERDVRLRNLLFRQSRLLFQRLSYGDADNILAERVPFYFDWNNWLDRRLGYKNMGEEVVRQRAAIRFFDKLVNSADSVYPQQLYYAANASMLLANMYDSLGTYDNELIEQIDKEILLRDRVFLKDPGNTDNIEYYRLAIKRLTSVCDSVGWVDLMYRQYPERLAVYRQQEGILRARLNVLPDSLGAKTQYISALAQLGASYLYLYLNRPAEYGGATDSALLVADKGLALMPNKFDSARFLLIKARAWLLKPGGTERSLALYREIRERFTGMTREAMLRQLDLLQRAGWHDKESMRRVREILKQ